MNLTLTILAYLAQMLIGMGSHYQAKLEAFSILASMGLMVFGLWILIAVYISRGRWRW